MLPEEMSGLFTYQGVLMYVLFTLKMEMTLIRRMSDVFHYEGFGGGGGAQSMGGVL